MSLICPSCHRPGKVLNDWWLPEEDSSEDSSKWNKLVRESEQFYQVSPVKCTSCDKYLGVCDHAENGKFYTISTALENEEHKKDCRWQRVVTQADRRALFVLNQIVYNYIERPDESRLEFPYALPPPADIAKLIWVDGQAVGFYTVKPKGTLDLETMSIYSMTTLDTIFIRKEYRRNGLAYSAIRDLITDYEKENIGFSFPISLSMLKVLHKYLLEFESDRPRLWEVQGYGGNGDIRNLWLTLRPRPTVEIHLQLVKTA